MQDMAFLIMNAKSPLVFIKNYKKVAPIFLKYKWKVAPIFYKGGFYVFQKEDRFVA